MASKSMKFGAHYLPTYVADLDGAVTEFYQKMFGQIEEMDRLGYDQVWLTEHHFAHYGGSPGFTASRLVFFWGEKLQAFHPVRHTVELLSRRRGDAVRLGAMA